MLTLGNPFALRANGFFSIKKPLHPSLMNVRADC